MINIQPINKTANISEFFGGRGNDTALKAKRLMTTGFCFDNMYVCKSVARVHINT